MGNSVEYYLSKGMDKKTAEYFSQGRKKPIKVIPHENYNLEITFDNNEIRIFDVNPFIKDGTVFEVLKDFSIFSKCYIDSDNSICWNKDPNIDSNTVWSNKIDLGADTCYLESRRLNERF